MKNLVASGAILFLSSAFLFGCGDENTTKITQVVGMQVLEKGEAMPKCSSDNEGAMVYSVDSAEAFYCINKKWKTMKGEKGEDGKKGADGEVGPAGADGKDGSSCTAKGPAVKYAPAKTLREIRLSTGLVFQNFNLFPHLTVLQNICLAPVRVLGDSREKARDVGRALLKRMGLEGKENSYPCELSGGQQQRVAIARALAMNPKILFFDEPTSALDPELTGEVLKIIKKLAEDKMTMVIVTHEMAFARDVADKVIFMDGGVIVEQGTPDYVFNQSGNERLASFLSRFANA